MYILYMANVYHRPNPSHQSPSCPTRTTPSASCAPSTPAPALIRWPRSSRTAAPRGTPCSSGAKHKLQDTWRLDLSLDF